jgi:hypothetical protein
MLRVDECERVTLFVKHGDRLVVWGAFRAFGRERDFKFAGRNGSNDIGQVLIVVGLGFGATTRASIVTRARPFVGPRGAALAALIVFSTPGHISPWRS